VAPGIRKCLRVPRRSGTIDSALGFRSWGCLRELGPSCDPDSRAPCCLFCLLRIWGLQPFGDQYHAHNFYCCGDVQQGRLSRLRSHHNRWRCEVPLELLEHLFCLVGPDERSGLAPKLEEQESPLSQSRDKLAQRDQATRELVHILDVGRRPYRFNHPDLFLVCLDSPVGNQETKQLARSDPEHPFIRIQLGMGCSQPVKDLSEIV
jgi:hypothetical protein